MLVHRATTNSFLSVYYASRAREYCFSLLTDLKRKLLWTDDDPEIGSIEEYIQDDVINANIGLEALQKGDMASFRDWVFRLPNRKK